MPDFKRAKIEVTLVDSMGSDLSIVNAARVSFDKTSEWAVGYPSEDNGNGKKLSERDAKLINYLAKHNHWTPFGHVFASFRVKAPFFVARQLGKHQVGLVWNEVSRRYVDGEPEFYIPDTLRGRAENVKQGSSLNAVETPGAGLHYPGIDYLVETALTAYKGLLNDGVAPEQARMVLPQNTMTEWIWSGSLAAWARVCKLRMDPHTQLETGSVAWKIAEELQNVFPVGFKALLEN